MKLTDLDEAMTKALRTLDIPRFEQLAAEADRRREQLDHTLNQPDALLAAALWYAEQGMPCFPCRPGDKIPLIPNPHPVNSPERATCRGECGRDGHGLYDANTDPEKIRTWWTTTPAANIGLPTGLRYDVIDIDGPTGYQSLAGLKADLMFPQRYAGRVLTPRGGMHIYIPAEGSGNAGAVEPGIDYRGIGGYVLAPPSRSAEHGRRWEWCNPLNTNGYQTVYTWEVGQ